MRLFASFLDSITTGTFDGHCFVAHSPDNSFLGFAVPQRKQRNKDENTRKAALVYGKDPEFWKVRTRKKREKKNNDF